MNEDARARAKPREPHDWLERGRGAVTRGYWKDFVDKLADGTQKLLRKLHSGSVTPSWTGLISSLLPKALLNLIYLLYTGLKTDFYGLFMCFTKSHRRRVRILFSTPLSDSWIYCLLAWESLF